MMITGSKRHHGSPLAKSAGSSSDRSETDFGLLWQQTEAKQRVSFQYVGHVTMKQTTITAEEFDRRLDEGEVVSAHRDKSRAHRPCLKAKRVNVDFPDWMVRSLDAQPQKHGVTRQALIKM
jgi:hypothetical protein